MVGERYSCFFLRSEYFHVTHLSYDIDGWRESDIHDIVIIFISSCVMSYSQRSKNIKK